MRRAPGARTAFLVLALVAGAEACRAFLPFLLRPDWAEGDACQHIWWTYRFEDPKLFPGDPMLDFFSRPIFAPYGFQMFYGLLAPWIDPLLLSEIIPLLLTIPLLGLAFLCGREVGGRLGGMVAAVYAIVIFLAAGADGVAPTRSFLWAGLPRSFGMPVFMLAFWALLARRMVWLGVGILLTALFYPPLTLNLGLVVAAVLGVRGWRERRLPEHWRWILSSALIGFAVLLYAYGWPTAGLGPRVSLAEARTMSEFQPGGVTEYFFSDPEYYYIRAFRSGLNTTPMKLAISVVAVGLGCLLLPRSVRFEVWALAGTSIVAYGAAHLTLFSLHLPNRYVGFTLPLFCMLWLAAIVPRAASLLDPTQSVSEWWTRPTQRALLAILVVLAFWIRTGVEVFSLLSIPADTDREATYAYLRTLPKDTLVAAHPLDAWYIPLRAQRSVLASYDALMCMAYYPEWHRSQALKIDASLVACYAGSWAPVVRLHQVFGVDVFVVNLRRYPDMPQEFLARIKRAQNDRFVLTSPSAERILFQSRDYVVVRLGPPTPREPAPRGRSQGRVGPPGSATTPAHR